MNWLQRFETELAELAAKQQLRRRQAVIPLPKGELIAAGRRYSHFSSNDYLGLSHHSAVIAAWQHGVARYGAGSGASGHVTGYTPAHQLLEQELAQWLNFPHAILFSSGFAANQALIFALAQKQDQIIIDRLMHASLQEAAHYSPAILRRFRHNDVDHLSRLLKSVTAGGKLVVTEGIFSMDGDSAPLAAIANCCQSDDWLMVDDAHGIGVTGKAGRGSCESSHIRPDILIVTFGKAFGVQGAAILCQPELAEYLTQKSRHLIYSTALPAAQAEAIRVALRIIQQGDDARAKLQENIQQFRAQSAGLPWSLSPADHAIQPLIIGDNVKAMAVADALRQRGIWVNAIRPPTVPDGTARLRFTLSASHRPQQITALTRALHELAE